MDEQVHVIWLDKSLQYSIDKFHDDMATKIIWGPAQTWDIWVIDTDSESKWKVRRDEHFEQLFNDRCNDGFAVLSVDVLNKYNQPSYGSSGVTYASGATSAQGSVVGANAKGSAAGANAEGSAAGGNEQVVHVVMQLVKELVILAALHLHLCQFKQHRKLIGLS
jgi:hypothetical protein